MGYLLVWNPGSGSNDGAGVIDRIRARLPGAEVLDLGGDGELAPAIDQAVTDGWIVVAVGGDGTVNAVAQHVAGRGTLGVVPTGTRNHFARDLGIRGVDRAVDALLRGASSDVDVGRAGERLFVNTLGMGLYPDVVQARDRRRHPLGTWAGAAGAAVRVLRGTEPLAGEIAADGDRRALLAWMLFVGNNRFGTEAGRVSTRRRLDEGVLDLRLLTVGKRRARGSSLAWRVLRGREWQGRRLVGRQAERVRVDLRGGPRLVARDGEPGESVHNLEVEIRPRALRVVTPGS